MSSSIADNLHNLITSAAGQYDVIFGADAGPFFMDVEQKSTEKLPFFGIFDTLRTWVDSFGTAVPIYAIYAFYSPDWADERKETTEEEITAAQLLRSFLQNLSPYLKNTPSEYNRFDGGAVSGVWCSAAIAVPLDCEGVPVIVPPAGDVTVIPLAADANGEYTAPTGVAYSPVTVAVPGTAVEDVPLIVERNGVTDTPDGIRYNPITVNVPQQTATDLNLFTRTHTLRGLTLWNPNQPIQDIRGWQLTYWTGSGSYVNYWSASGDVIMGVSQTHTNSFLQIVDLEEGEYRLRFFYKTTALGGLHVWLRKPWNATAGTISLLQRGGDNTWQEVDEVVEVPVSGRCRLCIGQLNVSSNWFYFSRPLLTPVATGVTDYVPAASDIAEGYYDNADFSDENRN